MSQTPSIFKLNSYSEHMDFIDKKEKLADILEEYLQDDAKKEELLDYTNQLLQDEEFKDKELIKNICLEINEYLTELSNRELKQRVLLIRSYID